MEEIQRFALEKIYCAPSQDRQFNFSLVRVNKPDFPVKRIIPIYKVVKKLPDNTNAYHVFVIGHLYPEFLNLLKQYKEWYKDVWVNAEEDMNLRNYIIQIYNENGILYPRKYIYYSFIDETSIVIAIRSDEILKRYFDIKSFKYLRVYSNSYFNNDEFNSLLNKTGIKCESQITPTNIEKVALQNKIINYEKNGGKTLVYVNGYYTDNLNLNIPDNSYVEILYDQSILSKEKFNINSLRTFESIKDNKIKYLLFRDKIIDRIQYNDDNEIYISTDNELVTKGIYFYEHKDYAVRNVTDKDYSFYTNFINNQATTLSNLTSGSIGDKIIVLFTRKSGLNRSLIYSSLKLHELYKLPQDVELDVLSNTNFTISEFRAENLENSDYFKIAEAVNIKDVDKEIATNSVGYNGITHYFCNTPVIVNNSQAEVPYLYQTDSMAFEYDVDGVLKGTYTTNGPNYTANELNSKYIEFIKGVTPINYGSYLNNDDIVVLKNSEFKIISAYFDGINRISNWEDITDNTNKRNIINNTLTLTEDVGKKVKLVYLDQPNVYDTELSLVDGILYFPLTIEEDRGTGIQLHPVDVPYTNIEIFLNGNRLNYQLDYFLNFPYVSICNKTYLDYSKEKQNIHIRMYGFTLNKNEINKSEIRGFVNNGVLTRNRYYDIRDDRVFSVYIRGKMYNKNNVFYSEDDNTVRTNNPFNGLPYTITEPFIPVKEITGLDTIPLYNKNIELNNKISDLFNLIYKEPSINDFNVISDHHYLFSPLVSKIIHNMLDGNISSSLYMSPYDDSTILNLLNTIPYKELLLLDPVKNTEESNIVEIHPDSGNAPVSLNLFQYRFLSNIIRIITQGKQERINLSGYVLMTT